MGARKVEGDRLHGPQKQPMSKRRRGLSRRRCGVNRQLPLGPSWDSWRHAIDLLTVICRAEWSIFDDRDSAHDRRLLFLGFPVVGLEAGESAKGEGHQNEGCNQFHRFFLYWFVVCFFEAVEAHNNKDGGFAEIFQALLKTEVITKFLEKHELSSSCRRLIMYMFPFV